MDNSYNKIEQYISGELKGNALLEFEKQIQANEELAKEVALLRQMKASLADQFQHEKEEVALKETLAKTGSKYFEKTKKPKVKIRKLWFGIAAAAAAIALFFVLDAPWWSPAPDDRYDVPLAQLSNRSNEAATELRAIETTFNAGNFAQALPLIEQYLQQYPEDFELVLLKGLSQLELDRYTEAQATFELIHSGDSAYKNEGTWYMAMTFLKQDKVEACLQYLRQIPADADKFKMAQELIATLE